MTQTGDESFASKIRPLTNKVNTLRKIAHLTNPFKAGRSSDIYFAQPVTFETMRIARNFARDKVEVTFLTAQYPEDREIIPDWFQMTPDLERSVLDVGNWKSQKKRPLMKDILDRLYEATDAEYLIYTNSDIALMPHFYVSINAFIDSGLDGFIINRRSISDKYTKLEQIPLMYADIGKKHEGHDCFVFRRDTYPQFHLGNVCVAIPRIGRVFLWNVFCHAKCFKEFTRKHLTFHLGYSISEWTHGGHTDLIEHNKAECAKVLKELEKGLDDFKRCQLHTQYPLEFNIGTMKP